LKLAVGEYIGTGVPFCVVVVAIKPVLATNEKVAAILAAFGAASEGVVGGDCPDGSRVRTATSGKDDHDQNGSENETNGSKIH
jgi:hypothetical protein